MFSEDHTMLRETLAGYLAKSGGVEVFRKMLADGKSSDAETWQGLSQMGWTGLLIDEKNGGSNMGLISACLMAENIGRTLFLSPILSSSILSAYITNLVGTQVQKDKWLPLIASGNAIVANGFGGSGNNAISGQIRKSGSDYRLSGEFSLIVDVKNADHVILQARETGTENDFLCIISTVEGQVTKNSITTIDGRQFSDLSIDELPLPKENVLGEKRVKGDELQQVNALGALIYAAEQYGSASAAFDLTLDFMKQREQFGKIIGSFQALQHRMAKLHTQLAMCEALNFKAALKLENNEDDAFKFCAMAKAKAGSVAKLVTNESIQLHGGIGMTDEYDVGLYLKRVAVSEKLFGNTHFHTDRVASLNGF